MDVHSASDCQPEEAFAHAYATQATVGTHAKHALTVTLLTAQFKFPLILRVVVVWCEPATPDGGSCAVWGCSIVKTTFRKKNPTELQGKHDSHCLEPLS